MKYKKERLWSDNPIKYYHFVFSRYIFVHGDRNYAWVRRIDDFNEKENIKRSIKLRLKTLYYKIKWMGHEEGDS